MKDLLINNGRDHLMIFDKSDSLCSICSYPTNNKNCMSCNSVRKLSRDAISGSFLKDIYPFSFRKIICIGEYHKPEVYSKDSKNSKYFFSKSILHFKQLSNNIPEFSELLKVSITTLIRDERISNDQVLICGVPDFQSNKYQKMNLLCQELSKQTSLPALQLLQKVKEIPKQHKTKSIKGKYENVRGAYKCDGACTSMLKDKTIFLIDDIVSTMASVNECSRILKEAGAKDVYVFALGRNILPEREVKK